MYLALAFALLLVPFEALYVFERMAKAGKGPLAQPSRMAVLDGTIVAAPVTGSVVGLPAPPEPGDTEGCAAETRLVAALVAGRLSQADYQTRMAELAAKEADVRPVRLPPDKGGRA